MGRLQVPSATAFQVVVTVIGPEFQRPVLQGYRVVALAADHDEDTLRTVS